MPRRTRLLSALAALAGIGAITVALIAEYGFGLRPCVLCLAQRVPFVVAGVLGLAALLLPLTERICRVLVILAGLAFLVNSGIAVYHVGVERHWWASPGCSASESPLPKTVAELVAGAAKPAEVPCDKPVWQWHGITMAGFNVVYSGGLALVILLLARRTTVFGRRRRR
jgi:disulfide bond formation protein DsbB